MSAVTPESRERVRELVDRYRRRTRRYRVGMVLLFAVPVVVGVLARSLFVIVGVGVVAVVLLAGPVLGPTARAVVTTDSDPAAVRDAVAGPYSPPAAFVWGRGDEVRATSRGGEYEWSALFGLRSATLSWSAEPTDDGQRVTFAVDEAPKAHYETAVETEGDTTVVTIKTRYEGRVGLNVLPSFLAARGLRGAVWNAQGYELREREGSLL